MIERGTARSLWKFDVTNRINLGCVCVDSASAFGRFVWTWTNVLPNFEKLGKNEIEVLTTSGERVRQHRQSSPWFVRLGFKTSGRLSGETQSNGCLSVLLLAEATMISPRCHASAHSGEVDDSRTWPNLLYRHFASHRDFLSDRKRRSRRAESAAACPRRKRWPSIPK